MLLPGCELVKLSDSSFSAETLLLEEEEQSENQRSCSTTLDGELDRSLPSTTGFPPSSDSTFFPLLPTLLFFLTEILCSLILNWCLITVAQNGDIHWQYSRGDQCLRGLLRLCTVLPPLQCQGLAEEISFPCYSYPLVTFPYSCVVEVWVGKQWRRPCALCSVFLSLFGWHQRSFRY